MCGLHLHPTSPRFLGAPYRVVPGANSGPEIHSRLAVVRDPAELKERPRQVCLAARAQTGARHVDSEVRWSN